LNHDWNINSIYSRMWKDSNFWRQVIDSVIQILKFQIINQSRTIFIDDFKGFLNLFLRHQFLEFAKNCKKIWKSYFAIFWKRFKKSLKPFLISFNCMINIFEKSFHYFLRLLNRFVIFFLFRIDNFIKLILFILVKYFYLVFFKKILNLLDWDFARFVNVCLFKNL